LPMENHDALKCLGSMLYADGERWVALPSWGRFLVRLGASTVDTRQALGSRVVALSVPTRSYAAAFLGLGVILAGIARDSAGGTHVAHANFLKGLPEATPIWLRRHNKRLKAFYEGYLVHEGVLRFAVRVERGTTLYIRSEDCEGIQLRATESADLPDHQSGLSINEAEGFLAHVLSEADASALVNKDRDDCVFVTSVGGLRAELCGEFLGAHRQQGETISGCFQDIIRVRQFSHSGEACRSEAFPVGRKPQRGTHKPVQGKVVVFDGALGYLRWRDHWAASIQLVVLDRTDCNWPDAAEALNREYVDRRCSDRLALDIPAIPAGVEVMAYEVPR